MPVTVTCVVCGSPFSVVPSRAKTARCCSAECQQARGGRSRPFVQKVVQSCGHCGQDFECSPSKIRTFCSRSCASSSHRHSEETRERLRESRKHQPVTPAMLSALREGRTWAKGKTKESHPSIAKRAKTLSRMYAGRKNPEHGKRMRRYYEAHPEKHPNHRMAKRGFISKPERLMRHALTDAGIDFRWQYKIGRYFADFALIRERVVVEVDGLYWHDAAHDAERDAFMHQRGWRVLRFTDKQILADLPACIDAICEEIQHPNPQTFPTQLGLPV